MARSPVSIDNEIDRFVASAITDVIGTIGRAVMTGATSRTSKQFLAFLDEITTGVGQGAALETHRRLAEQMAQSTRRSWGQAKQHLRQAVYDPLRPPLGPKNRYGRSHGGMDRALNDKNLVQATPRGIEFGNVAVLDREARQWARLNFGAGGAGRGSHEQFRVRFSNLPAIEFNFAQRARPGYGLPRGFFKGPDGRWQGHNAGRSGAFYVSKQSQGQEFPTKGNEGYNYLDAGIRRFFELLPVEYGKLFRQVLPSRRGRPPIIAETRRVTSPAA